MIDTKTRMEEAVIASQEIAEILFRFKGAPSHWRIAVDRDVILPLSHKLWIQEPHYREWRTGASCYGSHVVYAASPGTLYDWGDTHGGYVWDVSHEYYASWRLLPPDALPFERSRLVWEIDHVISDYYADFILTGNLCQLQEADHGRMYSRVLEVRRERW